METLNTTAKKWNQKSLIAFVALVSAIVILWNGEIITNAISLWLSGTAFEWFIYKHGGPFYFGMGVASNVPGVINLSLLVLAVVVGIKAVHETVLNGEKGRMLAIITTTISGFFLVAVAIVSLATYLSWLP